MYNMSADEILIMAKVFAYVMGDSSVTLTDIDKASAKYLIKKIAERRYNWTPAQKEQFKLLVESIIR